MPVHRRVTPSIKFAGAHLYTWVERGTVRVKCFGHTMSPARARTRTARSGDKRTNHEAAVPPSGINKYYIWRGSHISLSWFSCGSSILVKLEFGVFFWRKENRRKTRGAKTRTNNKLNPHMTPGPGIEPGPHWWKASTLTTEPSLLEFLQMWLFLIQ